METTGGMSVHAHLIKGTQGDSCRERDDNRCHQSRRPRLHCNGTHSGKEAIRDPILDISSLFGIRVAQPAFSLSLYLKSASEDKRFQDSRWQQSSPVLLDLAIGFPRLTLINKRPSTLIF